MHVNTVTQSRVTQTPKNCLDLTFFRGDQEKIVFTYKIEKIDWVFYYSGMNWLVRKLDVGDRNEPTLKGQTATSINVNNADESKESCIKIYILLKFN